MKRMPFVRPTEHYDPQIITVDKELCSLIQQRKQLSDNNPGFPPLELISEWASEYDLYDDFLKAVFGTLLSEEYFKPYVEPMGFRQHIPVLQAIEKEGLFFTLTSIRQYSNVSVITLSMDWDMTALQDQNSYKHRHFELFIGEA
ncbi:hypothetical protein [Paenibacillus donghaensis]|uniref:Uncharacterized protein n=1 Tax=Paenibacillus donghaensis TaxID=414771 RepID=A0A2Z2KP82_9BACL|nr:hypothetical protein [Paenibacillus donghaensis]ASA23092.1 hypothetical protein B9T62_21160 [Paenibacillus donghaensis]